ncbi:MAG: ABC transporter substrate-binding protein [Chloroflexi bacterium]|nr:ABC transporter substrate-binding protein [Chloroflexota bacterium]
MSALSVFVTSGRSRPWKLGGLLAAGLLAAACSAPAAPGQPAAGGAAPSSAASDANGRGGKLRIAMTAGDIPLTDAQADQGAEGSRFVAYQIYGALTKWDYEQGDRPPIATPGLAESWEMDKADPAKWVFKLRKGVKFHDGSDWNADVAVWGLDRVKTPTSPQYNAQQATAVTVRSTLFKSWRKIDDYTLEMTTNKPSMYLPDQMLYLQFPSKVAIEKYGKDEYPKYAAGTGPFKMAKLTPRQSLELLPNENYWGPKARLDKLVLVPMSEAATRLAALRSGQADWIEVPPADSIPSLKQDGFNVMTKIYPHVWPYQLNLEKPPFDNLKVRQAAMYAIDSEGLCKKLLNETCIGATSPVYPGHPWFGAPVKYDYNPEKAKQLLKESGYSLPIKATVLISPSGSGQMLPMPMNEFVQRNFKDVGIDLNLEVVEWNAMGTRTRDGFRGQNENLNAYNSSTGTMDPFSAFYRIYHGKSFPPVSGNTTRYASPEVDKLLDEAEMTANAEERDGKLRKVNEILSRDLPQLYIVHDLNPRAMTKKVKNYTQAQSWYTSLTEVWVEK